MYHARIIVNEMVVSFEVGIEYNGALLDRLHPEKSFLDKQIQCVVHCSS